MADRTNRNMATKNEGIKSRYIKNRAPSLQSWREPTPSHKGKFKENAFVQCGWGRVIFANTFPDFENMIECLREEKTGQRDIAFYVRDPHVATSLAPSEVFLDPSHTFRIWFENYHPAKKQVSGVFVRRVSSAKDVRAVNTILKARKMVPLNEKLTLQNKKSKAVINLVAESTHSGEIVGFVSGVDHTATFNDPEKGSSLWSLSVSPSCNIPGVGEAMARYLIEYMQARGNSYLDLSVIHKNDVAIRLYKKLKFERVPVYCIKLKNPINEPLYTTPKLRKYLNPYGQIIIDEAARRGIDVKIIDKEMAYFTLAFGGREITCRESLTDETTAIAMSICQDKVMTSKVLKKAGVKTPAQMTYKDFDTASAFLEKYNQVVVKPADSEQGRGVHMDIKTKKALKEALKELKETSAKILIEQMVEGLDIRVIVIDYKFVAAALRRPPEVIGDGRSTIKTLIKKLNRRRMAATQGESKVPVDNQTLEILKSQKLSLDSVLEKNKVAVLQRAANLHLGGTIEDITPLFSAHFREVAERAAKAIGIPVVGIDLLIPNLNGKKYHVIEANERAGLANHEPQPTAEKFIDFLFPQTRKMNI